MFTGIIETIGRVNSLETNGTNKSFWIESSLFPELKVDQSIAHDGVCLTVEQLQNGFHKVTAVAETLSKTNLDHWQEGHFVNLERCLLPSSRLDGHFVQGHVDGRGICKSIEELNGSWEITIEFDKQFAHLVIEKGSICLNGISLTSFSVKKKSFKVAIIPYTWQHTNLQFLEEDRAVNLEFDLIGKYISRKLSLKE